MWIDSPKGHEFLSVKDARRKRGSYKQSWSVVLDRSIFINPGFKEDIVDCCAVFGCNLPARPHSVKKEDSIKCLPEWGGCPPHIIQARLRKSECWMPSLGSLSAGNHAFGCVIQDLGILRVWTCQHLPTISKRLLFGFLQIVRFSYRLVAARMLTIWIHLRIHLEQGRCYTQHRRSIDRRYSCIPKPMKGIKPIVWRWRECDRGRDKRGHLVLLEWCSGVSSCPQFEQVQLDVI